MNKKDNKYVWILAVVIFGVVGFVIWSISKPLPGDRTASQGNQHIRLETDDHVAYNTVPPTSGPHTGSKASWGVQDFQVSDEVQIHNLEDGGVIVHYDPDKVSDEVITSLKELVGGYSSQVILEPYSDMGSSMALTAWGRIDKFDEFDEGRIKDFISSYKGIDHHNR